MDPTTPSTPDLITGSTLPTTGAGTTTPRPSSNKVDPKDAEIAALKLAMSAMASANATSGTPVVAAAPLAGPDLITKRDDRNGLEQALPAATWALLSADEAAHFNAVVTERPAALTTTPAL